MAPQFPNNPKNKLTVPLDLRIVVIVLLVIIAGMLFVWKPWAARTTDRTVQVTGEASVSAKPDEYIFYPSYEVKNADKNTALADVTKKSDEITKKLKDLGVADKDIKTASSGYDYPVYYGGTDGTPTYTVQFTITAHDLTGAQKIQDYLITTSPTGSVSPQAQFSDSKRKELETQARIAAAKDARSRADQMGQNIGFKVTKVKTITDGTGFGGGVRPMLYSTDDAKATANSAEAGTSLAVQPGENDLNYTVTVDYYIK